MALHSAKYQIKEVFKEELECLRNINTYYFKLVLD